MSHYKWAVVELFNKFYGDVGAQPFTQAASGAFLLRHDNGLLITIEFQDLFRTKSHANTAAFTEFSIDNDVFLFFQGLSHRPLKHNRLK